MNLPFTRPLKRRLLYLFMSIKFTRNRRGVSGVYVSIVSPQECLNLVPRGVTPFPKTNNPPFSLGIFFFLSTYGFWSFFPFNWRRIQRVQQPLSSYVQLIDSGHRFEFSEMKYRQSSKFCRKHMIEGLSFRGYILLYTYTTEGTLKKTFYKILDSIQDSILWS